MSDRHNQKCGLIRVAALAAVLVSWPAHQGTAQEHRQLGAHQHGHGKLNMAIEGQTLQAEIKVPGADIVGFEHPATTKADKDAVAAAKKKLETVSMVYALPAQAGCKLKSARVLLEGEDKASSATHHHEEHEKYGSEETHSEFHVEYALNCANVGAIKEIAFPYFKTFPNSVELDVTLITSKGQKTFEVNRNNTRIDIQDMM